MAMKAAGAPGWVSCPGAVGSSISSSSNPPSRSSAARALRVPAETTACSPSEIDQNLSLCSTGPCCLRRERVGPTLSPEHPRSLRLHVA